MKINESFQLKQLNTFKIDCLARYFIKVSNLEELKQAVIFAKRKSLPVFVLGSGSNILLPDGFLEKVVTSLNLNYFEIKDKGNFFEVRAGAGIEWNDFVLRCNESKVYGFENLSLIPGKVGTSVVSNIGAYGSEIKDFAEEVEVFDLETEKVFKLKKEQCNFSYRNSLFKKNKNLIVIGVSFKVFKKINLNFSYPDVEKFFVENKVQKSPENLRKAIIKIRRNKLPDLKKVGCAGSFFKNPVLNENQLKTVRSKWPEINVWKQEDGYKIPLAFVLEKLGFKNYEEGDVGVYSQPLVIVNLKKAKSRDIKKFVDEISKKVFKEIKVKIEKEVEYIK